MGPDRRASQHEHAPKPEYAAIALLDAFMHVHKIEITAAKGVWTVTGNGLEEPVQHRDYTDMITWLTVRYGWPA